MLGGKFEQVVVANRVRGDRCLREDRAGAGSEDGGSVSVLWVSTPMTTSTSSASMGNAFCFDRDGRQLRSDSGDSAGL
jgi:hypothetical protein